MASELLGRAQWEVRADTSKLSPDLDRASNLVKAAMARLGAAAAGFFTFQGLVRGLTSAVAAAKEADIALAQLEARLRSTRYVAGVTSEELQRFAASLQQTTIFSDDATIQMQAMLLSFKGIRGAVLYEATKAVQDLTAAFRGLDASGDALQQTAIQVGKALEDPIQGVMALRRVGVQMSDAQEQMIKAFVEANDIASAQRIILKELESQFGGTAEALRKTPWGEAKAAANAFGDTLELLGQDLGRTVHPALSSIVQTIESINAGLRLAAEERDLKRLRELQSILADPKPLTMRLFGDIHEIKTAAQVTADALTEIETLYKRLGLNAKSPFSWPVADIKRVEAAAKETIIKVSEADDAAHQRIFDSEFERIRLLNEQRQAEVDRIETENLAAQNRIFDNEFEHIRLLNEQRQAVLDQFEARATNVAGLIAGIFGRDWVTDSTRNIGELTSYMLRSIAAMIAEAAIFAALMSVLLPSRGSFGTLFSRRLLGAAQGAAFSNGRIEPFARGGVVNTPTIFPLRDHVGLMGEAGPEAVMPLTRLSDGSLGVRAEIAGGLNMSPRFGVYLDGEAIASTIRRLNDRDARLAFA